MAPRRASVDVANARRTNGESFEFVETSTPPRASARKKRMARAGATSSKKRPKAKTTHATSANGRKEGIAKELLKAIEEQSTSTARGETLKMRGRSYFEAHRGSLRTSNCTLADLNLPTTDDLHRAMAAIPDLIEAERSAEMKKLTCEWRLQQLVFKLYAGHSLLFYGFGSKRMILNALADLLQVNHDVVLVNGYNPSVSIRAALAKITDDILRVSSCSKRTLLDYVDAIRLHIKQQTIAFVIHNIEGSAIRNPETQNALAELSSIPGVLFVASVDHVNAPFMWNGNTFSTFQWAWINVHTYAPYDAEVVYTSRPMFQGTGERRIEGAVILLKSLSANARKVFRALAKCQTNANATDAASTSVPIKVGARSQVTRITFNALFDICRQNFLCTDTASLRAILTELETHDVLERRRGADAAEQLWIPLTNTQLESVLSQVEG